MCNPLIETILSDKDSLRNRSITFLLENKKKKDLLQYAEELESFRKSSENLYHKVRASLNLSVIYRMYLQKDSEVIQYGRIPFDGVQAALDRDFEKAVEIYLDTGHRNSAVFSALSSSYYDLSFKYLLDQVKLSISQCKENYHLYNINDLHDYPYSVPDALTTPDPETGRYPVGMDSCPVRLDPSHSGWSDIFFLGMDFPEGANVVNLSVNLSIHGSGEPALPPCECYCRFIEDPAVHLISTDLRASKKITSLNELFNFGNDYLSLLKAGVVASGIIPPCFENKEIPLKDILRKLLGKAGGIEIVTKVNSIPKGSRLAVSTTLLSTIITRLMRFSGQIDNQTGRLENEERRTVASRAILGEWLGGSGGGWQDSGGLWPGIKVIRGTRAEEGHTEFGISRGCLLPEHTVFTRDMISTEVERKIMESMVLVHGGISMDVGPVLEMVTEKYLLKYEKEWNAREKGMQLFEKILDSLSAGDMKELGRLTTEDWEGPLQHIIPWVNNAFTQDLINAAKEEFGKNYWGFIMLGGMSGGGMAFIVSPDIRDEFKKRISQIMKDLKVLYYASYPFIIDPVVYDFDINHEGIVSLLLKGHNAIIPEISASRTDNETLSGPSRSEEDEPSIKNRYGFDERAHRTMQNLLKIGEVGLSQNRLPLSVDIEDIAHDDILHFEDETADSSYYTLGMNSLKNNETAVVSFAGGMGSRWTQGATVVKPINPFVKIGGKYRTFIEAHVAKSRKTGQFSGGMPAHVFTTSYLTHEAIVQYLERFSNFSYEGPLYLSPAQSIGHRVYPMERDLRFSWEEQLQKKHDVNVQKVHDDTQRALIEWSRSKGEGEDYSENRHVLRFNPPGHWYEIPNLLKNGVLARMIKENENLKYLLCHNIDTLGVNLDPALLGMHIVSSGCITFEVTPRRIEDTGGGLARVGGRIRLIEGLALPREEDEYNLSYYNTLTNWITIDRLLHFFGLNRQLIIDAGDSPEKKKELLDALYETEHRIPTYVTIKNVRHLWGSGQEDVYPVAQFEKLWGDMTVLDDFAVQYVSVSRFRGLQLKEPSLLDMWVNDGSLEYFKSKCVFY